MEVQDIKNQQQQKPNTSKDILMTRKCYDNKTLSPLVP